MAQILIVEDSLPIQGLLRAVLEDAGHSVRCLDNGAEALKSLQTDIEPQVVLVDRLMPKMGGDTLLETVAADPVLAQRHAYILVTASMRKWPEAFTQTLTQLQVPVLDKPFNLDELVDLVAVQAARLGPGTVRSMLC